MVAHLAMPRKGCQPFFVTTWGWFDNHVAVVFKVHQVSALFTIIIRRGVHFARHHNGDWQLLHSLRTSRLENLNEVLGIWVQRLLEEFPLVFSSKLIENP